MAKAAHSGEDYSSSCATPDQDPDRSAIGGDLVWAFLACGHINMRKVEGWKMLAIKPISRLIIVGGREAIWGLCTPLSAEHAATRKSYQISRRMV